jgi:hypothetical protein
MGYFSCDYGLKSMATKKGLLLPSGSGVFMVSAAVCPGSTCRLLQTFVYFRSG